MRGVSLSLALRRIDLSRTLTVGALIALSVPGFASAQAPAASVICQGCHGVQGEGNTAAAIPRLAGQSSEYLVKQLQDYASGERENPVMQNFAKPLTPVDIEAIAEYFSAARAPHAALPTAVSTRQRDLGHQLAHQGSEAKRVQACDSCHGPDGVGVLNAAPSLAGQSAEYLKSALTSFQNGTRKNDSGKLMSSVVGHLDAADIAAASAYFSSLPAGVP